MAKGDRDFAGVFASLARILLERPPQEIRISMGERCGMGSHQPGRHIYIWIERRNEDGSPGGRSEGYTQRIPDALFARGLERDPAEIGYILLKGLMQAGKQHDYVWPGHLKREEKRDE